MAEAEVKTVQAEASDAGGQILCVDTGWTRRGFASLNGTSVAIVFPNEQNH
jgi:hypothetical protein